MRRDASSESDWHNVSFRSWHTSLKNQTAFAIFAAFFAAIIDLTEEAAAGARESIAKDFLSESDSAILIAVLYPA